jgi:hypothetical protein
MATATKNPYATAKVDYIVALTRELVAAHESEYAAGKMKLVGAVLFGPLAEGSYSEEIWLLEIVEGYPYPRKTPEPQAIKFRSTRDFPMLGHLRLWVMNPAELCDATEAHDPLIEQVRAEPKIFLLDPPKQLGKLLR